MSRAVVDAGDEIQVYVGEWVKIQAIVPGDVWQLWDRVCNILEKQGITHENEYVRNGMVIEMLMAEFLAGPKA